MFKRRVRANGTIRLKNKEIQVDELKAFRGKTVLVQINNKEETISIYKAIWVDKNKTRPGELICGFSFFLKNLNGTRRSKQ